MAEAPCATTFIALPRLPWVDATVPLDSRGELERAAVYESGFRTEYPLQSISELGVTLEGHFSSPSGARVTVELATGQRPAGTVAWLGASAFGVAFDEPINLLALINRNLINQVVERRTMPRVELRCPAWLRDADEVCAITIRNISGGGLQIEGDTLPSVGADVLVYVEGLDLPPGKLIWKRDNLAGVQLVSDVSWAVIVPWLRQLIRKEQ